MTCEEVRLALGAHALGALDPDEALEIDTHLATCEACGAELLELEGVSSFLGKVSERDVELVASPPRQVLDRLLNARAKRSRRGRLLLVAAASVALLGLGGTVWTVIQESEPQVASSVAAPSVTPSPMPKGEQPFAATESDQALKAEASPKASASRGPATPQKAVAGREFTGQNAAKGYNAIVMAWPLSGGGTELGVRVTGVPAGTTCSLVVVDKDGRRDATESWVVSREGYQDKPAFKSKTTVSMRDIARFEVVDQTGKVLVRVKGTGK
ncbi:putative zinc finger protein [Nonomuraea polychroma]|uniref:Putative zinc finger protein n=1 Tax=Nonomuraea polychroma TaxID=46176 RepID=A0A438MMF5_9ACTN|nr:zf-HC2 domain-containing protein [Nonomuraea polychroma]RVX46944.1 putative zinc finger protein [Nonomuraea polychroma]